MEKYNVRVLVNHLLGTREPDWEHVQTVKIGERSHSKLRALAEVVGRSKTSLAADLLMAAIDDAIEAVPNEPGDYVIGGEPAGLRDHVKDRADYFYEYACLEHQAELSRRNDREYEEQQAARKQDVEDVTLQNGHVVEGDSSE